MLFNGSLLALVVECQLQDCDPGVCAGIPGLVYNAELDQCAWPDEVGCHLSGNVALQAVFNWHDF